MVNLRPRFLAAGSAALLAGAVWAVPAASQAAPAARVLKCGQTVTASVRLANNLVACPGTGLRIGADNVTVDLAGHSITGKNTAGSEGIADDGHAGVRIQHGTIQGFFLNGIGLRHAPHSTVSGLTIRRIGAGGRQPTASAGVLVKNSAHVTVTGNTVTNDVSAYQSDGVDLLFSAQAVVSGNIVAKNAWNGMFVLEASGSRITGNTFDGNKNQGAEVNSGSDGTLISENHFGSNAAIGLAVGAVSGVQIGNNTMTGNKLAGLFMFDLTGSAVSHNRASANDEGIHLDGGQNVSTGNQISNNDTSGNRAAGLLLIHHANKNSIVGNISSENQGGPGKGGGIILAGVTGNAVVGNVVIGNHDVGIGIFAEKKGDSTKNVLTGNVALSNQHHGMTAVKGTTDGGGNFARKNIPLPNCVGVSCQ